MPRFYFHLRRGDSVDNDDDGTECADAAAARQEAIATARELLANAIKSGRNDTFDSIIVADDCGQELTTVAFSEVLPTHLRSTVVGRGLR